MILTYPNYYDQTQIIGLSGIHEYHGVGIVTPFPLSIIITESLEYGIAVSQSNEYGIVLSESNEYSIDITQSGG